MSALKLYLILINKNKVENVTTYRELDSILQAWSALEVGDRVGIIHCGFVRPCITGNLELPEVTNGKMVYSGALKWALPDFYKSTHKSIACINFNDQLTPCYLALNQWGYEIEDDQDIEDEYDVSNMLVQDTRNRKDTISLAAQQVLRDSNKQPLNKEEIYARIIESNYYQFNTPTPVHVLDVTLNRETKGTEYSKAAKVPVFGKTNDDRYYLLGGKSDEPTGWVYILSSENPKLYEKIQELGVSDEKSYLNMQLQLPSELRSSLDQIRFKHLVKTIAPNDPYELLKIVPHWILERHITELGFTVRIVNSLLGDHINYISELAKLKIDDLTRLPNMGKKSIIDICDAIVAKIDVNNVDYHKSPITTSNGVDLDEQEISSSGAKPLLDQAAKRPLLSHLNRTLDDLSEVDRLVLHGRLGYKGKVLTLEEIAKKLDVTRERIRQRQKKYVDKIIAKEYWDDVIGIRIGQLLMDREEPLILEMLEIEDNWFDGFTDCYLYLANVIQMFSENAIQVIEVQGRSVVTRISKKIWDQLLRDIKNNLRQKADQKIWSRTDVELFYESNLAEHSAKELLPLLKEAVDELLQFDGSTRDSILMAYGRSAESAVAAVLAQAEGPLHYSEIADRAGVILGRDVDERRAHNAVSHNIANGKEVWMYDRGTYGLIDHCPLPESKRNSIRQIVEHLLYQGAINKQWHSKEIIEQLKNTFPSIPDELDPYLLRMCIEGSTKINFLNRMVWARSDSGLKSDDRVELADAFIQILEEAGEPLSAQELKNRLSDVRGLHDNAQIFPSERLVAVGPNVWGLSDWN